MAYVVMTMAVFFTAVLAGLPVESNSESDLQSNSESASGGQGCSVDGAVLPDGFTGRCSSSDCNECACRNGVLARTMCNCDWFGEIMHDCPHAHFVQFCADGEVTANNCQCGTTTGCSAGRICNHDSNDCSVSPVPCPGEEEYATLNCLCGSKKICTSTSDTCESAGDGYCRLHWFYRLHPHLL
eukprot:GEMP01060050.1.p1 GENE.GEMP01060050.1~~GEMP01060050.1.p1  ORF type:complete len:203 (+),score=27.70 GEMP01060050.1:60-611(+)